ncbi:MAG: DUF2007 domain-containing protein [Candidatus Poribacteria bacterium]|nr:DUF2007 domain-containing protein [Candidatus Poribacteria bacterium]
MTTNVELIRWTSLTGVPHQVAAVMLMGVLEASDIPARLEEHTIPAYGLPSIVRGDAWGEVFVPQEHLDDARSIMEEYLAQLELDAEREYDDSDAI